MGELSAGRFLDVDGEVDFEMDLDLALVVGGPGTFARYRRFAGGAAWFALGSTPVPMSVAAKHEKVTLHAYLRQPT